MSWTSNSVEHNRNEDQICGSILAGMGIAVIVKYLLRSRVLWVYSAIPALAVYQALASEPVPIWGGVTVLVGYILFIAFIVECICREFSNTPWKNIDPVDIVLSVLVGLAVAVLALTVAIDLIPENYFSQFYTTNNVLDIHQCNEIVRVAELHAQRNIQSLLETHQRNESHPKVAGAIASGGWLTTRHANYPTTDISAYTINQTFFHSPEHSSLADSGTDFVTWVNATVENTIFPMLMKQFDLVQPPGEPPLLSMQDLFVVKYDADNPFAQRHLEEHSDSSQLSFNIALSTHWEEEEEAGADTASEDPTSPTSTTYGGGGTYMVRSGETIHTAKGAMLSHVSRLYHAGQAITRGKRYILVGFVNVRGNTSSTNYRRFGMFSRCVVRFAAERNNEDALYTVLEQGRPQCQSYPYVFLYELAIIIKDPFMKARTNPKSFWLAGIFTITILFVLMSIVSIIMLIVYPDEPVAAKVQRAGDNITHDSSAVDAKKVL